jgi:hypothetical protein
VRWITRFVVALAFVALAYGTVLVFMTFDRTSHSASDTLRPVIITIGPLWVIAVAAAITLLRGRRSRI